MMKGTALFLATLALAACGGDSGTAPTTPTYADVAGTYNGSIVGTSSGITVDLSWVLTMTRSGGNLTGTVVSTGTLSDFSGTVATGGTSTITGTVGTGTNPTVAITFAPECAASSTWSGTYTAANRRLGLSGDLKYYLPDCTLLVAFVGTTVVMFK